MKKKRSHFKFNKQERSGIFFLLLIIVLIQVGYFLYQSVQNDENESLQLDAGVQAQIEVLKLNAAVKDTVAIFPFNPNYITDYKGYSLGMSVEEIDRLHAFREQHKFANSAEEFQQVTQVSDSLLKAISPYFKFPEWTKKRKTALKDNNQFKVTQTSAPVAKDRPVSDLNSVTTTQLQDISGIGEKLSARIIKFRDRLGGFLVDDQLYDVYGLEPAIVKKTLAKFTVIAVPEIKKINVTWASYNELRNVLYINDKFAKAIIEHRKLNAINSLLELKKLEGAPEERFERLKLYLTL